MSFSSLPLSRVITALTPAGARPTFIAAEVMTPEAVAAEDLNLLELSAALGADDDPAQAAQWCASRRIIANAMRCHRCKASMKFVRAIAIDHSIDEVEEHFIELLASLRPTALDRNTPPLWLQGVKERLEDEWDSTIRVSALAQWVGPMVA